MNFRIAHETARKLRKNSTPAEKIFWDKVRNRQIGGLKFFRQHPIQFTIDGQKRFLIADFYCAEKKLVIEIDGLIHERQQDYDVARTRVINLLGINVIRFRNSEIENDIGDVIRRISQMLT